MLNHKSAKKHKFMYYNKFHYIIINTSNSIFMGAVICSILPFFSCLSSFHDMSPKVLAECLFSSVWCFHITFISPKKPLEMPVAQKYHQIQISLWINSSGFWTFHQYYVGPSHWLSFHSGFSGMSTNFWRLFRLNLQFIH